MDALNFEYPDYDRLDEGAGGAKRKRVVSILSMQAVRSMKEDEATLKKMKTASEPKALAPKKQKLDRMPSDEPKVHDPPEKTMSPPSPSAAEVSEILKVMTESPPFKLLSPLRLELTNLLQKKEIPSATDGRDGGQKKRCMMNILQTIEQTPPLALADKTVKSTDVEAAVATEGEDLTTTMSEIDKIISDMAVEKEVATEVSDKGKEAEKISSGEAYSDLRHLGVQ
jgi:hypothetical protein